MKFYHIRYSVPPISWQWYPLSGEFSTCEFLGHKLSIMVSAYRSGQKNAADIQNILNGEANPPYNVMFFIFSSL